MKCKDVYLKDGLKGEWVQDNVEHEEAIYSDEIQTYKFCTYCGAKLYPDYA
jgi:hypothetical protein